MSRRATSTSFKPGQSGNPGGRPKSTLNLQALCRELTPELIEKLKQIARDDCHKQQWRACELLLAYGHGRPQQMMNMRRITSIEDLTDEELAVLAGVSEEEIRGTHH